jgi:sec-independent protein translocase protein TatA
VPHLGMGELVVILMLALLVFGATRLPQIGEGMGRAIRNFKRGLSTDDEIDVTPVDKQVSSESSAKGIQGEAVQRQTSESKG